MGIFKKWFESHEADMIVHGPTSPVIEKAKLTIRRALQGLEANSRYYAYYMGLIVNAIADPELQRALSKQEDIAPIFQEIGLMARGIERAVDPNFAIDQLPKLHQLVSQIRGTPQATMRLMR